MPAATLTSLTLTTFFWDSNLSESVIAKQAPFLNASSMKSFPSLFSPLKAKKMYPFFTFKELLVRPWTNTLGGSIDSFRIVFNTLSIV